MGYHTPTLTVIKVDGWFHAMLDTVLIAQCNAKDNPAVSVHWSCVLPGRIPQPWRYEELASDAWRVAARLDRQFELDAVLPGMPHGKHCKCVRCMH